MIGINRYIPCLYVISPNLYYNRISTENNTHRNPRCDVRLYTIRLYNNNALLCARWYAHIIINNNKIIMFYVRSSLD